MAGGLYFTPEQIRTLPIHMQLQIGLGIAAQLAQTVPVAAMEKITEGGEDASEM